MALRDDVIIKFGGDSKGVNATMASIRTSISSLGSLAAGFGVGIGFASITAAVKETLNWADDLVNTANRVGMTTEAVQALRIEAEHYGVTQQQVDDGLTKFTLNWGRAQQGIGDLLPVLSRYGIALTDANGKQRSAEAGFADYIHLLQSGISVQEKVRIGVAGMGKGAAEFAQAMAESGVPMDQTIAKLKEMGLVMDDQGVNKLADLEQRWTTFTQRVGSAAKTAVLNTATAFEKLSLMVSHLASGEILSDAELEKFVNPPATQTKPAAGKAGGNESGVGNPSEDFAKYLKDRQTALMTGTQLEAEIWKQYGAETTAIRKGDEEAAIAAQKAQEDAFKALSKTDASKNVLANYQALVGEIEKTPVKMPFEMSIINADGAWEQLAAGISKGGVIPITVGVTPVLQGTDNLLWTEGSEAQPNDLPREVDKTGANP